MVGFANLLSLLAELLLRLRLRPGRSKAEAVHAAGAAVAAGDESVVNAVVEDRRVRRRLGAAGLVALAMGLGAGCGALKPGDGDAVPLPKMIVVPADRQVVRMTNANVAGWFVPDAVFAEMLQDVETLRQARQ